jgi:hypothetical protein
MVRAQRTQLKLLAALVAGTVAIACGGGDDKPVGDGDGAGGTTSGTGGDTAGGNPGGSTGAALTIAFNPMYSAFDGKHTFLVPVRVTGASGKLTVTTSPEGFVDSEPAMDGVTLTTRKAGKCKVTIKDAAGNSGEADLEVTQNDPADLDIGKDRYANGIDAFTLPEGGLMFPGIPEGGIPRDADGGIIFPEGGIRGFDAGITRNDMAACTFCHVPDGQQAANGNTMQIDVEHTPTQTAGYSDADLIKIFTEGVKPEGSKYRVVNGGGLLPDAAAARIYAMFHKWNVDAPTQKGIIAYLRGLPPKAQGDIDFGGLLRGGGLTGPRPAGTGGGATTAGAGTMDAGAP